MDPKSFPPGCCKGLLKIGRHVFCWWKQGKKELVISPAGEDHVSQDWNSRSLATLKMHVQKLKKMLLVQRCTIVDQQERPILKQVSNALVVPGGSWFYMLGPWAVASLVLWALIIWRVGRWGSPSFISTNFVVLWIIDDFGHCSDKLQRVRKKAWVSPQK